MMRVLLDGTPLLGNRAGIGRYTDQLLTELASRPEIDVWATAFSLGAARALKTQLPAGVRSRVPPIPARVLDPAWRFCANHPSSGWPGRPTSSTPPISSCHRCGASRRW